MAESYREFWNELATKAEAGKREMESATLNIKALGRGCKFLEVRPDGVWAARVATKHGDRVVTARNGEDLVERAREAIRSSAEKSAQQGF